MISNLSFDIIAQVPYHCSALLSLDIEMSRTENDSASTSAIIGGVIGAAIVALISAVVVVIIVLRYRKGTSINIFDYILHIINYFTFSTLLILRGIVFSLINVLN